MKRQPPGSSPLTRGKHQHVMQFTCCQRLIPAHAGKTPDRSSSAQKSAAHPRSRGENDFDLVALIDVLGSSPLTRGKLRKALVCPRARRLIPAHAGKTISPLSVGTQHSAHPRSRGENRKVRTMRYYDYGSSPLTRGKLLTEKAYDFLFRLIPAHAGKTDTVCVGCDYGPAHPRSRGENHPPLLTERGSSPLTRGKRALGSRPPRSERLIPAHAGKTTVGIRNARVYQAHPRSRGENNDTC